MSRHPRAIGTLLAVVLLALNLRAAITVTPPLLDTLEREVGLSAGQVTTLGSLSPLAFAIAACAGLPVMRRLGLERTAWVAMAVAAAGQLARVLFPSPEGFLAASAATLLGLGVGNVVTPPLVKRHFPARIALVTGLYVVSLQVGTALAAQTAVPLERFAGWQTGLGLWAGTAAVAMIAWIMISRARTGTRGPVPLERLVLADLVRSPLAWGMAVLFGAQSLGAYGVMAWLPTMYQDAGEPATVGGTALAVFALFQIPMSLFAPVLVSRATNPFRLLVAFVACSLVAYGGLAAALSAAPLLWAALLGIGGGSFPVALALIGLRAQTPAGAAALSAFAQGGGYLIAILGPFVCGILRQQTGSWHAALGFLGLMAIPLLAGGWIVSRPRTLESELGAARRT